MTYKEIYTIGQTLIQSYNYNKKLKGINGFSNKFREITPIHRYEEWSNKYFTLYSIYLIYKYSITNFGSYIERLKSDETKEFLKWKNDILIYKDYIKNDLSFLKNKYGLLDERCINDYIEGKIKFYTLYCILRQKDKLEDLKQSRVYGQVIKKIEFVMLFLNIDCEITDSF